MWFILVAYLIFLLDDTSVYKACPKKNLRYRFYLMKRTIMRYMKIHNVLKESCQIQVSI